MTRTAYETDLTDKQWQTLAPLIPPAHPGGRPRGVDMREVLNGIFYVLRGGLAWRHLPHDLPNWRTCWFYFDRFSNDRDERGLCTWEKIGHAMRVGARVRAGRHNTPTVGVIDAQSVRSTRKGGRRARSATTRARRSRAASVT